MVHRLYPVCIDDHPINHSYNQSINLVHKEVGYYSCEILRKFYYELIFVSNLTLDVI